MHIVVLLTIIGLAWGIRYGWNRADECGAIDRAWERNLASFLLPPLLLLTSAIAIVWMGPHGRMVWVGNDWLSYDLAIGFLVVAGYRWLRLARSGWLLLQQVRTYPQIEIHGYTMRSIDLDTPYSAQIGFWEPELVVTTGLLDTLTIDRLETVLAHEQAHYYYRDTWWFFWLGWVRQITSWLPQTEPIWQELLTLRELRADRWAADRTDPLLVAETLVSLVQHTPIFPDDTCAAFSQIATVDRLSRRIDTLLSDLESTPTRHDSLDRLVGISWLSISLLPLLTVPFHR
jgi:Zn-dependent protease with chaperone function